LVGLPERGGTGGASDPSGHQDTDSRVEEWNSDLCGTHFHSWSSFDDDDDDDGLEVRLGIRTEILNWLILMPTSV